MIEEFKTALAALILAANASGLDCEGILTVRTGDVVPATKDQPGVTVDFTGDMAVKDTGNHTELAPEFLVVLYVSSLKGYETGVTVANNLHARCAGTGQYRGLHRFLSRLKRWTDSAGTTWSVTLSPETDRGSVKEENAKFASFAIAYRLKLSTMLNKSQY